MGITEAWKTSVPTGIQECRMNHLSDTKSSVLITAKDSVIALWILIYGASVEWITYLYKIVCVDHCQRLSHCFANTHLQNKLVPSVEYIDLHFFSQKNLKSKLVDKYFKDYLLLINLLFAGSMPESIQPMKRTCFLTIWVIVREVH